MTRPLSAHLTPAQIASYIDGRLSVAEFNNANTHMADCRECTALLAGTVRTMASVAQYVPLEDEPAPLSTSWRLWLAVSFGSALGLAISAGFIWQGCV